MKLKISGTCPLDNPFPYNNLKHCCSTNVRSKECQWQGILNNTDPQECCDLGVDCPSAPCSPPNNATGFFFLTWHKIYFLTIWISSLWSDVCPLNHPFPYDKLRQCCSTNIRSDNCTLKKGILNETDPPECCDKGVQCPKATCSSPTNATGLFLWFVIKFIDMEFFSLVRHLSFESSIPLWQIKAMLQHQYPFRQLHIEGRISEQNGPTRMLWQGNPMSKGHLLNSYQCHRFTLMTWHNIYRHIFLFFGQTSVLWIIHSLMTN